MKRRFIFLLAIFILNSFFTLTVSAQEVTSQGFGKTPQAAVNDALRNALEYTVGTLVTSETIVENNRLIADQIYTKTTGYVDGFEIIDEERSIGGYKVTLIANINSQPDSKLVSTLRKYNLIKITLSDPRVAVFINEKDSKGDVVENAVMKKLLSAGFTRVIDIRKNSTIQSADFLKALAKDDNKKISLYAKNIEADFLLIGSASTEKIGAVGGGLLSRRAVLDVKLIKADTGEVITTTQLTVGGADITDEAAANKALLNAGERIGSTMVEELLAYAGKPEKGFQLVVNDISSFSQVVKLESQLNDIAGVKKVYIREFQESTVVIDVDTSLDTKLFAQRLLSEEFGLSITGMTGSSIKTRMKN